MRTSKRTFNRYIGLLAARTVSNASLGAVALVTAREVSAELRGRFILGLAISGILAVVSTLGINISARSKLRSQPHPQHWLGTYLTASLLLSVAAGVLAPIPLILVLGRDSLNCATLFAIAVYCATVTMSGLTVDAIHAINRHTIAAFLDAVGSATGLIAISAYFTLGHIHTLAGMLSAVTAGNLMQILICLSQLSRERDFRMVSMKDITRLVSESRGNHRTVVGVTLLLKGDRYIIGYALGPAAVSLYATAATVSELIWIPAQGLANYFYSSTRTDISLETLTRRAFAILTGVSVLLGALASRIILSLFGQSYAPSVHLVWVLLPGSLAMTVYFLDSARLMGAGRGRDTSRQLVLPLAVLLVGTSLVAEHFGLIAGAASCSMAYTLLTATTRRAASAASTGRRPDEA